MRIILILTIILPVVAFAGNSVGNGGNSIQCHRNLQLEEGLNNLDYALLIGRGLKKGSLFEIKDLDSSLNRIQKIISSLPIKAQIKLAFKEHRDTFMRAVHDSFSGSPQAFCDIQNLSSKICWVPVNMQSIEIGDQGDLFKIPDGCVDVEIGKKFKIFGTVARTETTSQITYLYSPLLINQMEKSPLQLSFLALHEYLWAFTDNVEINRKANWLFHSRVVDRLNPSEILIALKSIGVEIEKIDDPTVNTCVDFSGTYKDDGGFPLLEQRRQSSCDYSDNTFWSIQTGTVLGEYRFIFDGNLRPSPGIPSERYMQMWRGTSLIMITIFDDPSKMDIHWIKEDLLPNGDIQQYTRYVQDNGYTSESTSILERVGP